MTRRVFVRSFAAGAAFIAGGCHHRGLLAGERERKETQPTQGERPQNKPLSETATRELTEHRIARIEAHQSNDRYPRSVGRNSGGNPVGHGSSRPIRILVTDKGARGGAMSGVSDEQAQKFIGARVSDLFDVARGAAEAAHPIELPLYDLAGNLLKRPVCGLLGAAGPREVPIYSGSIYFDDLEPPETPRGVPGVLASCQQDYDAGYRAFKLKIGRGFKWIPGQPGIQRDIEVTRAVRQRFPDCKVLVDANDGYTPDDFLRKLREHMAKVGCRALIVDGESRSERAQQPWRYGGYTPRHIETLFALAREKLVDVFNLDLGIVGYTRWRQVMPELVQAGAQASPHTWAGTPRPYYAAHLAAGIGNIVIVEGIPGTATGLDYSAYRFADGKLVVPDAPGFGIGLSF